MQVVKPPHTKYLLHKCNNATYAQYFNGYSKAKRLGFRGAVGYLSGQNIAHIAYEIGKGQVIYWGKRRVGYALLSYAGWCAGPVMPMVTNSTKILKAANFTHRLTSEIFEISENGACAWLYPIDLIVFGQPVPVGSEGRFNIISNVTDVFDD